MTEEESVSEALITSVIRVLLRVTFVFEPLAPTAITIALNRQLHRYKEAGIIGNYKTKTKRLGKFHYRVVIDLRFNWHAGDSSSANLFPKQISPFRRWFHD